MKYSTPAKITLLIETIEKKHNTNMFEEVKSFIESHLFIFNNMERYIFKHKLGLYPDKKSKSLRKISSMLDIPVSDEEKLKTIKRNYTSGLHKIAQRLDLSFNETTSEEETCSN